MMDTRSVGWNNSISVLANGGPPMLFTDVPYRDDISTSHFQPLGYTDDQGAYLAVPLVSHLLGEDSAGPGLRALYLFLMALAVVLLPLLTHQAFGSLAAALAVPVALPSLAIGNNQDIYWISVWVVAASLPAVFAAYRHWSRWKSMALLGYALVLASFASSVRGHSGLPILVAAVMALLWSERRWKPRAGLAALLLVAYLFFSHGVMGGVREYRDQVVGDSSFAAGYPSTHPFWHSVYIGLGYTQPNKYGIAWDDSVAANLVKERAPDARYLSPEYEKTVRAAYFDIVRDDPGFVARGYLAKTKVILEDGLKRYWKQLLLVPFMLFLGTRRRLMRRYLLMCLPVFVLGLAPPVLTLPQYQYEIGCFAVITAVSILSVAWLAAEASGLVQRRWLPATEPPGDDTPPPQPSSTLAGSASEGT